MMKNTIKKPTNHLASPTERAASFKLPYQQRIQQLNQLTNTLNTAWQGLLPDNVLASLTVIIDNLDSLTISTTNHTFANHLTYSRQPLLAELHHREPSLQRIWHLKFLVIAPIMQENEKHALQGNRNVTNVTSCELSEITKQNISQVIELVTDDIPLQRALQKLLKS